MAFRLDLMQEMWTPQTLQGLAGAWAEQAGMGPLIGHQCPSGLGKMGGGI